MTNKIPNINNEDSYIIISCDETELTLSSVAQLTTWCEKELDIWQEFQTRFKEYEIQYFPTSDNKLNTIKKMFSNFIIDIQLHPLENLYNDLLLANGGKKKIQLAVFDFNAKKPQISQSPQGKKILELSKKYFGSAMFLYSIWHPYGYAETIGFPVASEVYAPYVKKFREQLSYARIEDYLFKTKYFKELDDKSKHLDDLKKDIQASSDFSHSSLKEFEKDYKNKIIEINELIKDKRKEADDLIKVQKTSLLSINKEYNENLDAIKDAYRAGFSMEKPVRYWQDQCSGFKVQSLWWGLTFMSLIILTFCLLPSAFILITSALVKLPEGAQSPYVVMFAISFPAFLVVWILRIASKNFMTSMKHVHEAKHRVVMTETFLALMAGKLTTDTDRILILNALFQPMDSKSDDGAPPNWYVLLMEKMSK